MNGLGSRKEAASAAPLPTTPLFSTLSLTNIHSSLELRSSCPGSDLKAAERYLSLFDRVAGSVRGRRFVDGLPPEDLFKREAMVVVARWRRSVIGGLHYHLGKDGLLIRGLAGDARHAGNRMGSAMVALALTHGRVVFGDVAYVECAIRQLPGGMLNEASRTCFARHGFELHAEPGVSYLTGSFRDRHLFESAEEDSEGGLFIRYRRMSAGPECYALARAFLAEWSQAILPMRPKSFCR